MPGYLLDFRPNLNEAEVPGSVRIVGYDSTGVKAEDIGGTGVYFEITAPFANSNWANTVQETYYGLEPIQWNAYFTVNSTARGEAILGGFPPLVSGTIKFWGAGATVNRHRILRVNGTPYQNDNPGGTSPIVPTEPTEAPFTADSEGKVYLEFDYVSINAVFGGIGFHFEDGPKIVEVNADENTAAYGEQCEMTVTGFESSVLWATIAGINCTDVSDNGFIMPVLVDETTVPMAGEQMLLVGNDDETAGLSISVNAPDGFRSVILGDDLNQTNTGTIFDFVPAAKEGDALFTPFVVDSKGNIIDAPAGVYSCWHLSVDDVDPNIAVARSFVVTLGGEQPGPDPLVVNFTYSRTDKTVQFTAAVDYTGEGDLTYAWDFGDTNTSTDENPEHTYDNYDIYTVTLTVTDGDLTDDRERTVRVSLPGDSEGGVSGTGFTVRGFTARGF